MKNRLMSGSLGLLVLLAGCSQEAVEPTVAPAFSQNPATVFINELHYDNAGTDAGEAVEIAGPAGTSLAGWKVVLYNGSTPASSTTYDTDTLSGTIPDQGNGYGTVALSYLANGIQNGAPDGLALVDPVDQVVQFLSYEGTMTASNGPASGLTSTSIDVSEVGTEPLGQSLQLKGTGATYQDFTWSTPADDSFGAVNAGQSFGGSGGGDPEPEPDPVPAACGDDAALISAVQGGGNVSPLSGSTVTLEAVVVGGFQNDEQPFSDLGGFYI